jgi:hypothetical protein
MKCGNLNCDQVAGLTNAKSDETLSKMDIRLEDWVCQEEKRQEKGGTTVQCDLSCAGIERATPRRMAMFTMIGIRIFFFVFNMSIQEVERGKFELVTSTS